MVAILKAVDKTSVALFILILVVCVLAVRRARQPRGITSLAALNVARTPGRTAAGAASLAAAVAAGIITAAATLAPAALLRRLPAAHLLAEE